MLCHCSSTLSAFIPTMSRSTEDYFFSLQAENGGLRWHCGLQPTITQAACGTESRAIYDLSHSRGRWSARSPSGKTYLFLEDAGFSTQHGVQGAELSATTHWRLLHYSCCPMQLHWQSSLTQEIPLDETDSHYFSCYIYELPEHISVINGNISRCGENSFSIVSIKILIYWHKALIWTTSGAIYVNNLLKDALIINC